MCMRICNKCETVLIETLFAHLQIRRVQFDQYTVYSFISIFHLQSGHKSWERAHISQKLFEENYRFGMIDVFEQQKNLWNHLMIHKTTLATSHTWGLFHRTLQFRYNEIQKKTTTHLTLHKRVLDAVNILFHHTMSHQPFWILYSNHRMWTPTDMDKLAKPWCM